MRTRISLSMNMKKLLRVALVGAPNVGKSTILNKLINSEVSCVSNKVHTTRKNVLAVYTENETQLEFLDSPGMVAREHLVKHRLEKDMINAPVEATEKCDLVTVVVDASNPRERKKLNKGILRILQEHSDKKSFLVMNKIDLLTDKRKLLDATTQLTEGCLEGQPVMDDIQIRSILKRNTSRPWMQPTSKYVIELDERDNAHTEKIEDVGYKHFNRVFSISALEEDGVDELRTGMLDMAQPVESWPHAPDYLGPMNSKEIVKSIIRGMVMDNTEQQVPYVVQYKFRQFLYDEFNSLHIHLDLVVPDKYMIGKLVGEHGSIVFKIINESREKISNLLGCDVDLNIVVKSKAV